MKIVIGVHLKLKMCHRFKKDDSNVNGTDTFSLTESREISFDELMILYAIIIQMAMKPNPGSRYTE